MPKLFILCVAALSCTYIAARLGKLGNTVLIITENRKYGKRNSLWQDYIYSCSINGPVCYTINKPVIYIGIFYDTIYLDNDRYNSIRPIRYVDYNC